MDNEIKIIVNNRKAHHDYHIIESLEAGIALKGTEVKSLRAGKVNIRDSFALITGGEVFLHGLHISPYKQGNRFNHDPLRIRKLLLHRREINRLFGKVQEKGYTLIPLKLYWKNGRCKVELALAKGKRLYDKRESLAKRDISRQAARALKSTNYH
ncbi:MAG: SsrA-binding protein SmpB [Firmicutes bacterium]|nr:SsrA-binding protein SmpB [Bacillota bacterium]